MSLIDELRITLRADLLGLQELRPPEPAQDEVEPLLTMDADDHPIGWSWRQAAGLRFGRWLADHGAFDDDLVGGVPEPLPPIVRESAR